MFSAYLDLLKGLVQDDDVWAMNWGALAIMVESYMIFCAAMSGIGVNIACVLQYRFAAAENVAKDRAGTAISLMLFTGVAAAFIGPEVGVQAKGWIARRPNPVLGLCHAGAAVENLAQNSPLQM